MRRASWSSARRPPARLRRDAPGAARSHRAGLGQRAPRQTCGSAGFAVPEENAPRLLGLGEKGSNSTVQGTGQDHPAPFGRPEPSPPNPLPFLQRTRGTAHAPPHSTRLLSTGPPKLFPGSPTKHRRRPETPRALASPHLLGRSNPPRRVLPAPPCAPRVPGSQTQTRRKGFARSLPAPALSLKQKRREGGR